MPAEDGADGAGAQTPVQVIARGAAAGLVATLLLSGLSRVLPGLWNERPAPENDGTPVLPGDPFNAEQVREWQARSQAPAAYLEAGAPPPDGCGGPPAVQPSGALTQPQGPGPEGLAEQFAFKLASGVFGRDISPHVRPFGMATHLAYGTAWGVVFGLLQSSYRLHPGLFGSGFGMLVYGIGPAWLVPAMKIMPPPQEELPERTGMLIAGHLIYGVALAEVFDALEREER